MVVARLKLCILSDVFSNAIMNKKLGLSTCGGSDMQENIQRFGRVLSGMVMPNIGAFIAWGIITALFIPTGWAPNERLGQLVDPMVTYLLPILIGYTGGYKVYGMRGGVLGAIGTSGVIVGAGIPMFIGAMIMGPLSGWLIKRFDDTVAERVPTGFEMLVNNFSAGIVGAVLALVAYSIVGPVVLLLNGLLRDAVEMIVRWGALPAVALFIEPGKILFLNNAINHGVLGPIGIQQAQLAGRSVFFLLESNPGPGLGVLLAYWLFGRAAARSSAPGAALIHFLGGIHEIYFPYVLMNPPLLLAVIAGGMSGIAVFTLLGAGLVATPSPGSIFALLAMTPRGYHLAVLGGVAVSTLVSFAVAAVFVKRAAALGDGDRLEQAREAAGRLKYRPAIPEESAGGKPAGAQLKVVYACDAGMGSSAMGAGVLRNKFKQTGGNVSVTNCAIENIPPDADVIVTHEKLAQRVKATAPQAEYIFVSDFINNDVFELLEKRVQSVMVTDGADKEPKCYGGADAPEVLLPENILLNRHAANKAEAIRLVGTRLVEAGYTAAGYIDGMLQRENDVSTYMGRGVAIPHGANAVKKLVKKTGIVVVQFPQGVDFGTGTAYLVVGIAAAHDEHLTLLADLAVKLTGDAANEIESLWKTDDPAVIYDFFVGGKRWEE